MKLSTPGGILPMGDSGVEFLSKFGGFVDPLSLYDHAVLDTPDLHAYWPLDVPLDLTLLPAPEAYETFDSKGTTALTVMDSGHEWGLITGGSTPTGAGLSIIDGAMTNTANGAGSAAGYGEFDLGAPATGITAVASLGSGGNTGSAVLIMTEESIEANGVIPDGAGHFSVGRSTWSFGVLEGDAVVQLASGSHTVAADDPFAFGFFREGSEGAILLPDGRIVYVSDSRIETFAGNWACGEVYEQVASTDAKAKFHSIQGYTRPISIVNPFRDLSGNGHDASGMGSIGFSGVGPLDIGDSGTAVLNGTSQYVTTPLAPFVAGAKFTFTGWVWRDNTSAVHSIFGSSAAANAVHFRHATGGLDIASFNDSAAAGVTWTGGFPGTEAFHHVAYTFDDVSNVAETIIDGVSKTTKSLTAAFNASPGNLRLGARNTSAFLLPGKMAKVAWFDRVLTLQEIQTIYEAGVE